MRLGGFAVALACIAGAGCMGDGPPADAPASALDHRYLVVVLGLQPDRAGNASFVLDLLPSALDATLRLNATASGPAWVAGTSGGCSVDIGLSDATGRTTWARWPAGPLATAASGPGQLADLGSRLTYPPGTLGRIQTSCLGSNVQAHVSLHLVP